MALVGAVIVALALVAHAPSLVSAALELDITVPAFDVRKEDSYVCTTVPLPSEAYKLVGVQPLAEQEVVHHILLFGCSTPHVTPKNGKAAVWDCTGAPTCSGGETVIYGWGRNAGKLELPPGVGFSVGGATSIKYIVAQVHYLQKRPQNDKSGVRLTLQAEPVPSSAGMLSYASWFSIPPGRKHHLVQNQCCYRGFQPLTTFAVRVHTHHMGQEVVMTRPASGNATGLQRLARGDPQLPQGFYALPHQRIWPGDRLAVTCDFDSSGMVHEVAAGPTHEHEMCNMYVMVYSAIPHMEMCSDGTMIVPEDAPGNMPAAGTFLPDPYPLWKPPMPDSTPKEGKGIVGDVASTAIGSDGSLWALHRGGRVWDFNSFDGSNRITYKDAVDSDVVVQMDPDTGAVLRRWGAGLLWMPHMITLDRQGNVWVTDVGRHQVLKFSPDGKLLMEVGQKLAPGGDRKSFCKPTQVAFLADGGFVVGDGYCNSRVMRFKADGSYHSVYTKPVSLGAPMLVVHSVLVQECDGLLLAADREGKMVVTWRLKEHDVADIINLQEHGQVWALVAGPYGKHLALAWQQGKPARLIDLSTHGRAFWELPGMENQFPHDIALGPAPLALTGAGDRLFAAYVAPLCKGCGPLRRFVLFPPAFVAPHERKQSEGQQQLQQAAQKSGGVAVVEPLAHGGGFHPHVHGGSGSGSSSSSGSGGSGGSTGGDAEDKLQQLLTKEAIASSGCACAGQPNCSCATAAEADLLKQLADVQQKLAALQQERGSVETERSETFYGQGAAAGSMFGSVVQVALVALVLGAFVGTLALWGMSKVVGAGAVRQEAVQLGSTSSRGRGARSSDWDSSEGSDSGAFNDQGGLFDGAVLEGDMHLKESDALLSGIPSRHRGL